VGAREVRRCSDTPLRVKRVRADTPAPLAAVVRKLMAKHPDDRYRTPGELAQALDVLLRTGELPGGHAAVALPLLLTITGHVGGVNAVAFGAGDRTIVSGGADRSVRVW